MHGSPSAGAVAGHIAGANDPIADGIIPGIIAVVIPGIIALVIPGIIAVGMPGAIVVGMPGAIVDIAVVGFVMGWVLPVVADAAVWAPPVVEGTGAALTPLEGIVASIRVSSSALPQATSEAQTRRYRNEVLAIISDGSGSART